MMGHAPLIPVIIIFIAVVGGVMAVAELLGRKKNTGGLRSRIDGLTTTEQPMQTAATADSSWNMRPESNTTLGNVTERPDLLPTITKYVSSNETGKRLRVEMHRAGLRLRPAEFVGLCLSGVIVMSIVGYVLTHGGAFMTVLMGALGLAIPIIILKVLQSQRNKKFGDQLPDALTLIASSLRTGYSFMNATEMVINEMKPPIAEEFAWARGEAQLGVPMETALQRMVERIGSYDLDLVVTSVSIQLQVGGNLAEILDTISETIRERIRIKGEIASLTAEGKLSGVIVFCLPIFLVMILNVVAPGYFDPLMKDPRAMYIIGVTIALMLIGGALIYKMVNVDV